MHINHVTLPTKPISQMCIRSRKHRYVSIESIPVGQNMAIRRSIPSAKCMCCCRNMKKILVKCRRTLDSAADLSITGTTLHKIYTSSSRRH